MITVHSKTYIQGKDRWDFTFKGLSSDTKPLSSFGGNKIAENSLFLELDSGNIKYYEEASSTLKSGEITTWTKIEAYNITAYMDEIFILELDQPYLIIEWNGIDHYCPLVSTMDEVYYAPEGVTPQAFEFVLYRGALNNWFFVQNTNASASYAIKEATGTWNTFGGN